MLRVHAPKLTGWLDSNATRAMTCMVRKAGGDQLLSVEGYKHQHWLLIVNRDEQIDTFQPEPFWRIEAHPSHDTRRGA